MQANVFPLPPAEFVVIPLPAELRHHRYVPAIKLEGRRLPTLQERIDSNCLNSYCLLLPPTILETHACGGIEHPRRGQGWGGHPGRRVWTLQRPRSRKKSKQTFDFSDVSMFLTQILRFWWCQCYCWYFSDHWCQHRRWPFHITPFWRLACVLVFQRQKGVFTATFVHLF